MHALSTYIPASCRLRLVVSVEKYDRISNLKYESIRIDSKIVVFTRAHSDKKEMRDGPGSHVKFFEEHCTFPEVVSHEMWARDQKFRFTVTD